MNPPASSFTHLLASVPARRLLERWFLTSSMASVLSMLVLAWHGRQRHGSSTALINAPSHVIHGDRALRANAPSLRFTALGALVHHASSLFWAMLYEGMLRALPQDRSDPDAQASSAPADSHPSALGVVASASALSALAWVVDTRLVPRRLTPGFERRSSRTGLALIYGAFAAGLAMGALAAQRGRAS